MGKDGMRLGKMGGIRVGWDGHGIGRHGVAWDGVGLGCMRWDGRYIVCFSL